jgi:hypothetical protein
MFASYALCHLIAISPDRVHDEAEDAEAERLLRARIPEIKYDETGPK